MLQARADGQPLANYVSTRMRSREAEDRLFAESLQNMLEGMQCDSVPGGNYGQHLQDQLLRLLPFDGRNERARVQQVCVQTRSIFAEYCMQVST
jgi:hypothetical protein